MKYFCTWCNRLLNMNSWWQDEEGEGEGGRFLVRWTAGVSRCRLKPRRLVSFSLSLTLSNYRRESGSRENQQRVWYAKIDDATCPPPPPPHNDYMFLSFFSLSFGSILLRSTINENLLQIRNNFHGTLSLFLPVNLFFITKPLLFYL